MLDDNKLWSRKFMLPEHNHAIANYNKHKLKKAKPMLSEDKLNEFTYVINESIQTDRYVVITEFDEFQDKVIEGKVIGIDQHSRRLKIENENETWYVPLGDIVQMELK